MYVCRSDGNYKSFVLNRGQFRQINVRTGGVSASIYADKPVMVVMFMKSQDGAANALVSIQRRLDIRNNKVMKIILMIIVIVIILCILLLSSLAS